MKDDLLILKLLKVPVTIIKYLSKFVAMLTYLPNYLVILILDAVIFNSKFISSLLIYCLSWPFRLLSLVAVIAIFTFQFYGLYALLSIQHFHWGIQLGLSFVAFQGVLALMRHGYLTMIKKFSPTKLKSPKEHLQQLWQITIDIGGIILALVNCLLIINIPRTVSYTYNPSKRYNFLWHISKLLHKSVLDIIKLFYIKVFFRLFPWRYSYSKHEVEKEQDNILQLMVLLTLLWLQTSLDLICFAIFGIYCRILHPRRRVYVRNLSTTHEKYKITLSFLFNSLLQLGQCLILLFCLPFKFSYSKQVLALIVDRDNDYSFHYIAQTLFVLKLALVKIPALICQSILLIFYYKHKKIGYLSKQRADQKKSSQSQQKQNKLFVSKLKAAPMNQEKAEKKNQKQYWRTTRFSQRQYLVFSSFGSLLKQIPFYPLIAISTLLKPWNVTWLKYLIDDKQDLRIGLVIDYFFKTVRDYIYSLPTLISVVVLFLYDPLKQGEILKKIIQRRAKLKKNLPKNSVPSIQQTNLQFYQYKQAIMLIILSQNLKQIKQDILFLPLFFGFRLSLLSLMGSMRPSDSVQILESLWMEMYKTRVRRSGYYEEYLNFEKIDSAAGMIKNQRQRLRFWKFAHKSVRHRLFSKILSLLLPKKRAEKAIANAEMCTKYSAISNHYWHRYNITKSLFLYWIAFVIELIVTLIGIVILMPLTLWRMPTFLILFRIHDYKKKMFFSILFPMYKQMFKDVITIPIKIITLIMFPRASISFYFKTAFRYTEKGIQQFQKVQYAKLWFVSNKIFIDGLFLYLLFWKVHFVKIFWVRKRDMNLALANKKIKLSVYMKDFLLTPQSTPKVKELMKIFSTHNASLSSVNADPQQFENKLKIQDINSRGKQIQDIVNIYLQQTIGDIPYLLLMVFLFFTLPWRLFYIRNALFLMRDDQKHRGQFLRLLKLVAKDYQCIFLYFVLFISIVKTRRALTLFYRNFKLNFYIGILKYSHLQELRLEVKQAGHFYKSLVILLVSCCFAPYRIISIYRSVGSLYRLYKDEKFQEYTNKKIYQNTIKQGKSLELITKIGNNSLQHVFRFLDAKQLTKMTRVCRYMYETIKQRDEVWMDQWDRLYSSKYPNFQIKSEMGALSYNAMCIQKFKQENAILVNDNRDRFYKLAIRQFSASVFETRLDIKQQLRKFLPQATFDKLFTRLQWDQFQGYGPQDNWPQPNDNPELLMMLNIQRRPVETLDEESAFASWLFERPSEYIIMKLSHIYGVDSHRRKKQFLLAVSIVLYPVFLIILVFNAWSWVWDFTAFFGYKLLLVAHFVAFNVLLTSRFERQSRRWTSLHPFDLYDDIVYYWNVTIDWTRRKSVEVSQYIRDKGQKYIVRPIKKIFNYFRNKIRQIGRKAEYYGNLFVEKIAKPLYISISHKIVALWRVVKSIGLAISKSIKKLLELLKFIVVGTYNFLFSIVKSISSLYSNFLEYFLRLSLKFGTIGELIFTIIIIAGMVSPSIICYYYYFQRWFIIFSTLASLVLVVTGYKHLNRIKVRVLNN